MNLSRSELPAGQSSSPITVTASLSLDFKIADYYDHHISIFKCLLCNNVDEGDATFRHVLLQILRQFATDLDRRALQKILSLAKYMTMYLYTVRPIKGGRYKFTLDYEGGGGGGGQRGQIEMLSGGVDECKHVGLPTLTER